MKHQIEVPGDWDAMATLMAFTDSVETQLPLTDQQRYLMRLVIEEIATNIVKYGYDDSNRDIIQLTCTASAGTLSISIRDRGRPFDPRDHPDPDLETTDPNERDIGGLGLYFVREYADTIDYRHDPATGWNELHVVKGQ